VFPRPPQSRRHVRCNQKSENDMIIDNETITLKEVLKKWTEKSDEILICSPFISYNDLLFELIEQKFKMTLICRLSYPATPELFSKLNSSISKNQSIYVFDDSSLHSKIYLFKKDGKRLLAIIGSSNFTNSGISTNKEYNIITTEELDRIDDYFKFLIKESYGKLSENIIKYYKTFYKKPEKNERYRRARISNKLVEDYSATLDKFYVVKGMLEHENTTQLPFTYIFDSFCHFFKTRIISDYQIKEPKNFNKLLMKKYFKIFLNNYFNIDSDWRYKRYNLSKEIADSIQSVSDEKLKDFFIGIHSISSGSGSGNRMKNIKDIDSSILRDLLSFLLESDLDMPQKYSVALTDKKKYGLKVPFIGESSIGEIPGWLIPDNYPIKNGKLHYVLDFFKV
jgi:HKD family nuclease